MKALLTGTLGCILSASVISDSRAEDDLSLDARKAISQANIGKWNVRDVLRDMRFDPIESLAQFRGDCTVTMLYDPKNEWAMKFKFAKGNKELVSISGHKKSVFGTRKNILFFVEYPISSCGATVVAYDLTDGRELWKRKLQAIGVVSHFVYSNEVGMHVHNFGDKFGEISIFGRESLGSYIEILDAETGEMLAHRRLSEKAFPKSEDSHDH